MADNDRRSRAEAHPPLTQASTAFCDTSWLLVDPASRNTSSTWWITWLNLVSLVPSQLEPTIWFHPREPFAKFSHVARSCARQAAGVARAGRVQIEPGADGGMGTDFCVLGTSPTRSNGQSGPSA